MNLIIIYSPLPLPTFILITINKQINYLIGIFPQGVRMKAFFLWFLLIHYQQAAFFNSQQADFQLFFGLKRFWA